MPTFRATSAILGFTVGILSATADELRPSWYASLLGQPSLVVRGRIAASDKRVVELRLHGDQDSKLVQRLIPVKLSLYDDIIYASPSFRFTSFVLLRNLKDSSVTVENAFISGGSQEPAAFRTFDLEKYSDDDHYFVISRISLGWFDAMVVEGSPTREELDRLVRPLAKSQDIIDRPRNEREIER